jgi:ribosomal protein S18 acetylase RimI-like enzyme
MTDIRPAELPHDLDRVRSLFREYAESLGIDLEFQHFQSELETLPGRYQPPQGQILLAWRGRAAVGCVALRPLEGSSCEMKRLYVRPDARGEQLGRQLAERVCQAARAAGYSRICLDTLPSMGPALELYKRLGFKPIERYTYNPVPDAMLLALDL